MPIRGQSDGEEKAWARKVLLLFCSLMKGENEGEKLAFMPYMECLPPSDEVDKSLRFACLQLATSGSAEERHNVEKG